MNVIQEFTHIATPEENSYIESLHSSLERELIHRNWFENIYHARMLVHDYYQVYNFKRKHRSLKKRSPYHYIKTFFPDFSDKHPFAFTGDLSRVAWDCEEDRGATCLALDENPENDKFVNQKNQDLLLN